MYILNYSVYRIGAMTGTGQRAILSTKSLPLTALTLLAALLVGQIALMNSKFESYTIQTAPLLYVVLISIFALLLAPGLAMLKTGSGRHGWILASCIVAGLLIIYFWIFFLFYLAPLAIELVSYSQLSITPRDNIPG